PHPTPMEGGKGKQSTTDHEDNGMNSNSDCSNSGLAPKPGSSLTHWTVKEETILLDFVLTNKAMMGDGHNFKGPFWNDLASQFLPPTSGKAKTADSYREKWKRVSNGAHFLLFVLSDLSNNNHIDARIFKIINKQAVL
ncbi:hypothetical protein EV363DRAFT_1181931, partial [Boletus edulis]